MNTCSISINTKYIHEEVEMKGVLESYQSIIHNVLHLTAMIGISTRDISLVLECPRREATHNSTSSPN